MSNADKLVAFLRAHKGEYFCDRCLSERTGITPLAQINQLAHPLEHAIVLDKFRAVSCEEVT